MAAYRRCAQSHRAGYPRGGHKMESKGSRRRVRAVAFGVALGAVLLVVGFVPFASGASVDTTNVVAAIAGYPQNEADQMWYFQDFLASDENSLDLLNRMGVDLGESIERNPNGTIGVTAVVTAAQRDYLAGLGFKPGGVIQTESDAESA